MALVRYPDWPARLAPLIAERLNAPFRWGTNDCALFACDAVLAMTGTDLAADFRGRYDSSIGAARALRALGFRDLADVAHAFAAKHGIPPLASPRFAQRGDVGLIAHFGASSAPIDDRCRGRLVGALGALAIATGDGFAAVTEDRGLVKIPTGSVAAAWRI